MDWPVATVILGTLATVAVGVLKWRTGNGAKNGVFAKATDMAEIRARLVGLEQAHHQLRLEIRGDIKELQQMVRESLLRRADV